MATIAENKFIPSPSVDLHSGSRITSCEIQWAVDYIQGKETKAHVPPGTYNRNEGERNNFGKWRREAITILNKVECEWKTSMSADDIKTIEASDTKYCATMLDNFGMEFKKQRRENGAVIEAQRIALISQIMECL